MTKQELNKLISDTNPGKDMQVTLIRTGEKLWDDTGKSKPAPVASFPMIHVTRGNGYYTVLRVSLANFLGIMQTVTADKVCSYVEEFKSEFTEKRQTVDTKRDAARKADTLAELQTALAALAKQVAELAK